VTNKIQPDDIYECMIDMHDMGKKITIGRIAGLLNVSSRTIHRHMCEDLKKEKELLNQQL
jgi:transcriptional antiterminator